MRLLASFLISLLALPATAKPSTDLHQYTLDNGLKLVIQEDHRAPVAVVMVAYHVGSADEPGGLTGISHMLEHMMFKGTPKYPVGQFSKIIADQGGEQNAFTSTDVTTYYEKVAIPNLPKAIELEADRMQNLVFDQKEFDKEHQVVIEEWRMRSVDVPSHYAYERFMATAHVSSPYHHPTIGWESDLTHLTLKDLQQWYQRYYAPNNAILVITGDVEPEKIFDLVKQRFGSIPKRALPEVKPMLALNNPGLRRTLVERPAKLPQIFIGFNTPSLVTAKKPEETYALNVAANILSGGDSARFPKNLVRQEQKAVSINADYDLYSRYDGLFTISAIPAPKYSPAELETAIVQQLKALQDQPVNQKELDRIKIQVIAAHTYKRDSMFSQGMEIAILENLGVGAKEIDRYTAAIQAVTPAQVQAVAKEYFVPERMTVTELKPLATQPGAK